MGERVGVAMLVALIWTGVPIIYNICKRNKDKIKAKGKVYFGIARMALLYIASIISSEAVLILIFGTETIEGLEALLLTFIGSVPFMYMYVLIYKKYQEKKLKNK